MEANIFLVSSLGYLHLKKEERSGLWFLKKRRKLRRYKHQRKFTKSFLQINFLPIFCANEATAMSN